MYPALGENYDCTTCGACCFGKRDYVQVFADDIARLGSARTAELVAPAAGEIPASVGRESEPKRFMKMTHGHCRALLTAVPNRFLCAVYEDRPMLCRRSSRSAHAALDAVLRTIMEDSRFRWSSWPARRSIQDGEGAAWMRPLPSRLPPREQK